MNLRLLILTGLIAVATLDNALADSATNAIKERQYVVCGTSENYKSLAYKQDNVWDGVDADICRAIAAATLDNAQRFKLIPIKDADIGKALNTNKIDVMLGHPVLAPSKELSLSITPAATLYLDRLIFASRQTTDAQSMKDFSGAKVCVQRNSDASSYLKEYNQKYALGLKPIEFPDAQSFKEAFYLKRCDLIFGSEILIKDMVANIKTIEPSQVLPEEVAYITVKAYTATNTPTFNAQVRWIINALRLAHAENITSQNVSTFKASKSPAVQNLLGYSFGAWQKLGLEPEWVADYIPQYGNYWQILERSIGSISPLQIDISHNDLIKNGGLLSTQPFF